MRRRQFIGILGSAAAWPLVGLAQTQPTLLRVGAVLPTATSRKGGFWSYIERSLRELGYSEGQNLTLELIDLEGNFARYGDAMKDLVGRKVDIIVAYGPEIAVKTARAATDKTPIVMTAIDFDPLALGYVKSLARPDGNVTGVFFQQIELSAKRIQLIKDMFPALRGATVLWDQTSGDQWLSMQKAGNELGVRLLGIEMQSRPYNYDNALAQIPTDHRDGLIIVTSPIFFADRVHLAAVAAKHRLATMFSSREWVDVGGLLSYGPSFVAMGQRTASFVDRIARGAKPADLPVEQPTKFELVVNLKTAKAIGIEIPQSILLRADEVIE